MSSIAKQTTVDKLTRLINRCKAGISITINEHRNHHQTAADYLTERDTDDDEPPEIESDVRYQMIGSDTIINLRYYPDTPVGFIEIWHYDLDLALDEALAEE